MAQSVTKLLTLVMWLVLVLRIRTIPIIAYLIRTKSSLRPFSLPRSSTKLSYQTQQPLKAKEAELGPYLATNYKQHHLLNQTRRLSSWKVEETPNTIIHRAQQVRLPKTSANTNATRASSLLLWIKREWSIKWNFYERKSWIFLNSAKTWIRSKKYLSKYKRCSLLGKFKSTN